METRCQCGLVQYSIPYEKPFTVLVCHCGRCKQMTGSVYYIALLFPYFDFPTPEIEEHLSSIIEVGESGNKLRGWFCKGCGNRMAYTDGVGGKKYVSASATRIVDFDWKMMEDRELVTHVWTKHAVVPIPEGFKSHDAQPAH